MIEWSNVPWLRKKVHHPEHVEKMRYNENKKYLYFKYNIKRTKRMITNRHGMEGRVNGVGMCI